MKSPLRAIGLGARTAAQMTAEADRLDGEAIAAGREVQELEAARPGLVIEGTSDQLEKHDAAIRRAALRREQAAARRNRLLQEREPVAREEELERRRTLYKRGRRAREEAERLIRTDYVRAAAQVVDVLDKLAGLSHQIHEANRSLPGGELPIESAESFRDRKAVPDRYEPIKERRVVRAGRDIPAMSYSEADVAAGLVEARMVDATRFVAGQPGVLAVRLGDAVRLPSVTGGWMWNSDGDRR